MTLFDLLLRGPWSVLAVVVPLAAAAIVFAMDRRRAAGIGLVASMATAGTVTGLVLQVWHRGPQRYPVGGWGAPLGIDLYADGLSALMLLMTGIVGLPVTLYARAYFRPPAEETDERPADPRHFWSLWLFLWASLHALFLSADIFNLYVALELITLAAVSLVALHGGATVGAALRYLMAALAGSLLYLMAVALLYWSAGTLDVSALGSVLEPGTLSAVALALATIGLLLKSALFPLHFWLPPAHAGAPAPVSAVLSALVVKASYYLLLRLWLDTFGGVVSPMAAAFLGVLGAGAIVWGSIQAMRAARLKLLVAYSTVAQLGYLFLVFPLLATQAGAGAWQAGALYALSHAAAKGALFLAAGSILHAAGHDRLSSFEGLGVRLPVPVMTMALAAVVLMGLPPGGTFVAKWLMLEAALRSGQFVLAAVVVTGGLLSAGYMFRVLAPAMSGAVGHDALLRPVPRGMRWSALALALVAALLGGAARPALALLDVRGPVASAMVEADR
jgi:multicomponent Na+:H+ antiporter subunit D